MDTKAIFAVLHGCKSKKWNGKRSPIKGPDIFLFGILAFAICSAIGIIAAMF